MTTAPRITVDGELFLGRIDEQERFRDALRAVMAPQDDDAPPFIFLLHGEGGIGKSKLTRRFRDIAAREAPFESSFHVLLVDWELKRDRNLALQVGRDAIRTETVFDVIHRTCVDEKWGKHFGDYQKAVQQRHKAEQEVAQAMERLNPETGAGRYADLRDLSAAGIAKLVRLGLPVVGDTGEALAQAALSVGIQVGAEQILRLRQSADDFLRAQLDSGHYDIFRQPEETLARALAEGLERVSRRKPLALLLDTYEIVARADPWLREVIKHAGPRVIWVIAGRPNLAASRPADRFIGYSAEFPRRLTDWDVRELAIEYVLAYLRDRAPERETTRREAEAIHRATLGVPLAIQAAADLWAQGKELSAITEGIPDHAPHEEIMRLMTDRVLIHCDDPADRNALYFLAIQRHPDPQLLQTALRPAELGPDGQFDLRARLNQLARRYSSVRLTGGARLHEAAASFIRRYLLTTGIRATVDMCDLTARAAEAVLARRKKIEKRHPLLEDRCESENWTEATLNLAHWTLWRDEYAAWDEIMPRFIEGLGYERDLCRGLLDVLDDFELALSRDGRKRFKLLRAGLGGRTPSGGNAEKEWDMLAELMDWTEQARATGSAYDREHNDERRAILYLRQGKLLHRREQYTKALTALEQAQRLLPDDGEALKQQLGQAFYELSNKFIWPKGASTSVQSQEGLQAAQAAVELFDKSGSAHYNLGVALQDFGRYDEALAACQEAIQREPRATPYNGLGNVYRDLGRREEAIAAYQRAIELDPDDAAPHYGLGNVYADLGRREEAIAAYQRAIELDPDFATAHNNLGNVYRDLGRQEEAIAAYQRAIELDPDYAYPHHGLGNVYRDLGRREEAIAAYQRAIALDPDYAAPHNNLGTVYADLGRHEEAIAAYQRAIELDPDYAYPHNNLGNVYRGLGRPEEAIAAYQRAIALDPDLAAPHYGLGNVYYQQGRREEAIAAYEQAIELNPDFATAHNNLGIVYADLGRREEAIAAYQRAIALDPDYATAHNGLGNVYDDLGRSEEAIAAYQRAIELDPDLAAPHHNLGDCYLQLGRLEEAHAGFEERVRLSPDDALSAQVCLGVIARHQGDTETAQQHFERALALWDTAWQRRLQSPAGLLENKAHALLGLGRPEEAVATLRDALAQRLPGDTIDFYIYDLLAKAPDPPDGLDGMIALLREAAGEEV